MTKGQMAVFDAKALGAPPEQLAIIQTLSDKLVSLENGAKLGDLFTGLQDGVDNLKSDKLDLLAEKVKKLGGNNQQAAAAKMLQREADGLEFQKQLL
jgi:hypothetical protein